jgi:ABC-type Fe2+-enterobactin transport system substrate-binding protein
MPFSSTTGSLRRLESFGNIFRARWLSVRPTSVVAALVGATALLVATFAPTVGAGATLRSSGLTEAKQAVAQYSGVAKAPPPPGPLSVRLI